MIDFNPNLVTTPTEWNAVKRRETIARYLAGKATVNRWLKGWQNPPRTEQDRLAEDIRAARVAARVAVALAGGDALTAYRDAMRATMAGKQYAVTDWTKAHPEQDPEGRDAEVARWCAERTVKAARSGNQNRRAAGTATARALELLGTACGAPAHYRAGEACPTCAEAAAALDLDADPSCGALDAARAELAEALRVWGPGILTAPEERALGALRAFEATVMVAVDALRGNVVQVLRLAQLGQQLEGPFGGDALTGGAEGLRLACRVYRQGPKCMGSFARQHWIVAGAVRALRGVWSDVSEAGRSGVHLLSLDHDATSQDAHTCEVQAGGGERVGTGEGTAATVVGCEGPEALMMRWERGADLRATVAVLPPEDRSRVEDYLEGRRRAPLGPRILGALRDLICDVGPGEVFA